MRLNPAALIRATVVVEALVVIANVGAVLALAVTVVMTEVITAVLVARAAHLPEGLMSSASKVKALVSAHAASTMAAMVVAHRVMTVMVLAHRHVTSTKAKVFKVVSHNASNSVTHSATSVVNPTTMTLLAAAPLMPNAHVPPDRMHPASLTVTHVPSIVRRVLLTAQPGLPASHATLAR